MSAAILTPRVRAVLLCAARGMTAVETARELHVSERTVWAHRAEAITRLGVSNTVAAVSRAHELGELK